jgi:putative ABC transport system ATP-binding protein
MTEQAQALEVTGLRHSFFPGTPNEQPALQGINLAVEPGSFLVLLGGNGSGKSTLLNAIAGAIRAQQGTIRIGGRDVTRWPEHQRAALIGRVFQSPFAGTAPHLTLAENLALAAERGHHRSALRWGSSRSRRRALADRLHPLGLGLENRLDTPLSALSGGQRQAVTLLMATFPRPELLLLDEHTAALDPRSAELVVRITEELITGGALTTLMVTHSMHQAVRLGDRLIMMHRGRIVEDFSEARKRRLKVDDLLDLFVRSTDLLDESAAEMLRRSYV